MDASQAVPLVTGIAGSVLGAVAWTVSIMTYRRDKPKLIVKLQWDMTEVRTQGKFGIVRVSNVGRRPVFLAIVALEIDKKTKHRYSNLILNDSVPGVPLAEGGNPTGFMVNYDNMSEYKNIWNKIRAVAEDTGDKKYYSKYPKEKPSWAEYSLNPRGLS
jgi:hypothetical protein